MKTVYDSANDSANDFTNYEQYFTIKERLDRLNQNMQKEKTMFNILLVVPYPKLEETARKVYQSYFQKEDFHVDIRVIRAEEMESTLLNQKYDLLIGRGKSAAILKKIY